MGLDLLFFGIGLLVLLRVVWQDFKNDRMVDARNSSFMIGIVLSMFYLAEAYLWFLAYTFLFLFVLKFYEIKIQPILKRWIYLGSGDVSILLWVMPGILLIHPILFFLFVSVYLGINCLQTFMVKQKYPGTVSIFLAFLACWILKEYIGTIL